MKAFFICLQCVCLSISLCLVGLPASALEDDITTNDVIMTESTELERAYGEAKTLTMPNHYYQSNSQWANITMQTCGDTIGQSGCALTSFAMIVNYYGSSDNPAQVNTKLGNLACPLQYAAAGAKYGLSTTQKYHSDSTLSYLSAADYIRTSILASRPVLVGLKKSNGSTHFVVAYGYVDMEPGGTPSVPILDPSSVYNHTSLTQYYNEGWEVHRLYDFY